MDIVVKEVLTRKDLRAFIKFPDKLFKKEPLYIPALHGEEKEALTPSLNPAFQYCDVKMWLAYYGKEVVGRVCAIINNRGNERWNEKVVKFGWFDFVENIEVCKRLLEKVEEFGRQHGMSTIHGPMGFTDMDKECWVIKGFDCHQNLSTIFNPPYYIDYIEQLGYKIDCKWQQYCVDIQQGIPEQISRIANIVKEKYNLHVVKVKHRKEILPYGKKFFHTLNDAYKDLYGFVPLMEKEIDIQVKKYFSFVNLDLVSFVVNEQDDVVGFGIGLPDLSSALRRAKGHLFPFGWIPVLWSMSHYDKIDLLLTGVHPDWQKKGVHAIFHQHIHETALAHNLKYAYTNPQIVSNEAVKVWNNQYDQQEETITRAVFSKEIPNL